MTDGEQKKPLTLEDRLEELNESSDEERILTGRLILASCDISCLFDEAKKTAPKDVTNTLWFKEWFGNE